MNQDPIQRTDPLVDPLPAGPSQPVKTTLQGTSPSSGIEQAKQVATQQAHDTMEDIKDGATQAIESAREAGNDFIHDQKERLAATLDEYTHAVKAACDSLEGEPDNPLAGPAHRASRQLERATQYIRDHEPADILHDLGEFARRRPELVFGGMFVAGMASVRFLKASARHRRHDGNGGDLGTRRVGRRQYDMPRSEPLPTPAPVGPPPAFQTTNPNVLP